MHKWKPILVALLLIVGVAACQPAGQATPEVLGPQPQVTDTPMLPVIDSTADVPRIAPSELWAMVERGDPVLIADARSREAYATSHIQGAVSIPEDEVRALVSQVPEDVKVVFY